MAFFRTSFKPFLGDPVHSVVFQYAELKSGVAVILGFVPFGLFGDANSSLNLHLKVNDSVIPIFLGNMKEFRFNGGIVRGACFSFAIGTGFPCGDFNVEIRGSNGVTAIPIAVGPNFPLTFSYRHQWLRLPDDRFLRLTPTGGFRVFHASLCARFFAECSLLCELLKHGTIPEAVAAVTRLCYHFWRPFHRGRYWIFSDKLSNPIDSAYSIAKTLVENEKFANEKVVPYYVIDGKHSLRVKLPGKMKTVRYLSLRHRLLSLAAEANITSEKGYTPFVPGASYSDITAWQFRVSSLHGLVHHDLSSIYGRDSVNFNLMIAGVKREAEYERSGLWGYAHDDVICCGLPRWDDRESAPQKKISISFTWRSELVESSHPVTKELSFGTMFENSEYRRRLNSFLSNRHLKELAEKYGYSLEFLPHPLIRNAMSFLKIPSYVHVVPEETPYEEVYRGTSLFVTDYSSVAMDMAYLGKPVIYYQFDHDDFYATQGYTESYFSWKEDGFGPVVTEEENVIAEIERLLERDCVREEKYEHRAHLFFPERDKKNGLRACCAIFKRLEECRRPRGGKSE